VLKYLAIGGMVSLFLVLAIAQDTPSQLPSGQPQGRPDWRGGGRRFQGVGGTITAIDKSKLSLTIDGKAVTVNLTADTRYRKDRQPATLADFKVGDTVMVAGDPAGENTWNARFVSLRTGGDAELREALGKRFIAGEIKSIDGTSLTILRVDGVTQTIQVDENTSFRKQNESITLADFKPGDHVFGRGELKNGTFVAAVLNAGEPQPMGMQHSAPDRH